MDEFEALVHSVGENSVDYIGKDALKLLTVTGDPQSMAARVEICLEDNSWAEQTRVIDRMIEIRTMFLDELSIDYVFVDEDNCTRSAARRSDYSYA